MDIRSFRGEGSDNDGRVQRGGREGGRTTFTLLVEMASKDDRDALIASGMEAGMQAGYDLLEEIAISLR
jgi:hypothetical protein